MVSKAAGKEWKKLSAKAEQRFARRFSSLFELEHE